MVQPSHPTPTLRPSNVDERSLLAQMADSINSLEKKATANLSKRPQALTQVLERLEETLLQDNTLGPSLSAHFFDSAMQQQCKPGQRYDNLKPEEKQQFAATAALNIKAVTLLANAGQLSAKTLGALAKNSNAFVDNLALRLNNVALSEMPQNQAYNRFNPGLDPNSPMAVRMALQSADGSNLVHILQDSMAATVLQMNMNTQTEIDREVNETSMLDTTSEVQRENQVTVMNVDAENELELEQEQTSESTTSPTPQPRPSNSSTIDKDEKEVLKQSASHGLEKHDLVKQAQSGAFKEVTKLATHGLEKLAEAASALEVSSSVPRLIRT